ncbi:hypothetical protein NMG60_11012665 [Bertholletia excelsa]
MDPEFLLDYAVFQLTPTRTRCDLVVFSRGNSEKLASGLVQPFVSHLKFAKDQIPTGGYSITLRPPAADASWFTKATFQRFVRFVSTPEVLERFARLEKEILQIDSSVQHNESVNGNVEGRVEEGNANGITKQSPISSKLTAEVEGTDDDVQDENSKLRLQRLLETRKALLQKEQAMAYARALAAGFELDNIDDLVFFADAFGASRLREACTEFKELCKKKLSDGLWIDELARMEACPPPDLSFLGTSGITLTCDGMAAGKLVSNGSTEVSSESDVNKDGDLPASDSVPPASAKAQVHVPWPNQMPPYMFSFQHMPPYQAYSFPGMQQAHPYYPGNMHWPQNMDEKRQRSSSRKEEKSSNAAAEMSDEEEEAEYGDSDTGTDPEATSAHDRKYSSKEKSHKKNHRKKSSKTVVIRNINYITSKGRNEKDGISYDSSSVEDVLVDEDSIKQKVEDVIGSLEKQHKPASKNKKRDGNRGLANGHDDASDQDFEDDSVKSTSNGGKGNEKWDALQNLLMKEKKSCTTLENQWSQDIVNEHFDIKSSVDLESEKVQRRQTFGIDSFVVSERNELNEVRANLEDFGNDENLGPSVKRRDCGEEAFMFPQRSEESRNTLKGPLSDGGPESSIIKKGKGEDWFVANHSVNSESPEATMDQAIFGGGYSMPSEGDPSQKETSKKIVPVDDSFMVQSHTPIDDQYDSQWKTDIAMVSDIMVTSLTENGTPDGRQNKNGLSGGNEPDDLCVVLARDSGLEPAETPWSPKIDYVVENSFTESEKKSSVVETNNQIEDKTPVSSKIISNKNSAGRTKQSKSKVSPGSVTKSRLDVLSQSKKPFINTRSISQKSKMEKEEEARKRAEELLLQRQKRIAERTAASGLTPVGSKKVPVGSKSASPKSDKHRPQSVKVNGGSAVSKSDQLKKTSMKVIGGINA